jgi:hypothetical protein
LIVVVVLVHWPVARVPVASVVGLRYAYKE